MKPEVSIVVPIHNGEVRLGTCLEALLAQRTGRSCEIIVVDDGSTDNTAELVKRYPDVRLVRQRQGGPAAARNNGCRQANGEIVLFTDDDCAPEADWIERMLEPFDDPEVVGAKGTYATRQRQWVARFVQMEYEEKYAKLSKKESIDLVDTHAAAFRREIFLDAGGYDSSFPTASVEDREFSCRLANSGHRLVFAPKAKVWHTHTSTVTSYVRKKFKNGYWGVLLMTKNRNVVRGTSDTPFSQKMQMLLTVAFVPSLAAVALGPWGLLGPSIVAAAFLLSTIPLTARCLLRDPAVAVLVPFLAACRALGLATGLTKGLFDCVRRRPAFR